MHCSSWDLAAKAPVVMRLVTNLCTRHLVSMNDHCFNTQFRSKIGVEKLSCGHSHFLLLSKEGDVYASGSNQHGQLGIVAVPAGKIQKKDLNRHLHRIESLRNITDIACGGLHSLACTNDGTLYSWGCGLYGSLGHGDRFTPT